MLRVTKATDPITVERLVLVIYSPPGTGKTTLAFTAEKPLLLDFDEGVHRAGLRHDTVQVKSWEDVSSISPDDLKTYKTVVIDTAGRALDVLTADIIRQNPKLGRAGGALTLQGFGELKSRFISFTKLIRSFGLDIVMLAHCDEQKNGDEMIERIDVQGGSKNEIYKAADVMGRLFIRNGQRFLNFNPTDTAFGKNPGQLGELPVPKTADNPTFLGDVITQVKQSLNKLTSAQQEQATLLAQWQIRFDSAETPDALNALFADVRELANGSKENVGRLWLKTGKAHGWKQDDDKMFYADAPAELDVSDFNPLAMTTKDGATKKQITKIDELTKELGIEDPGEAAGELFAMAFVKVDELSKDGADQFIAELTARVESKVAA
jgi:hypothetical protein